MGLGNFFTTTIGPQAGLGNPLTSGKSALTGVDGAQSMDFLGLILSRLGEANDKGEGKKVGLQNLLSQEQSTTAKQDTSQLSLADFLAANPNIRDEVKSFIEAAELGDDSELLITLGLNDQAADDALIPVGETTLTTAAPEEQDSISLLQILQIESAANNKFGDKITGQINALRQKIQKLIENGETATLTTNLTPEQITALANAQDGEWPEELKGIGLIMVALVQPQDATAAQAETTDTDLSDDAALANALIILVPPQQQAAQKNSEQAALEKTVSQAQDEMTSRLNDLAPGSGDETADEFFEGDEFETALKNAEGTLKKAKDDLAGRLAPENKDKQVSQQQSAAANYSTFVQGAQPFDAALYSSSSEALALYDDLAASAAATPVSTQNAALASLSVQAGSAAASHPATALVAVNIQKAANAGADKTISVELDPPELGRIEVKLTFAKDKSMKAHVIAEKPETYMMLQRDASTLERALDASGLEGGGLSFELAEQGFDFNGNNNRGGGHDQGGTGAGGQADAPEIIETTLTWRVDPETGHTRYDIYA